MAQSARLDHEAPTVPRRSRRVLLSAWVGHAVEWYEFSIYGVMAGYLAVAVFPAGDPSTSLMLTWATFAVAFLVRPLGGIVISHVADRLGRKRALFATVLLMTIATTGIALVPPFAAVGVLASVLFVCLRILQGFAVGGEMSSAVPWVAESVPAHRRTRSLSWLAVGTFGSALAGAVIASALAWSLGPSLMQAWGWRIPFLLALPLGLVALALRTRAPESAEFDRLADAGDVVRSPLREALRTQGRSILSFLGVALCFNVALAAALSGYLSEILLHGIPASDALLVTLTTYVALIASIIVFARLPDRLGRRRTLAVGILGVSLLILPQLWLGHSGSVALAALGGAIFAVPAGLLATPVYLALTELFPPEVRSTSGALGFNIATALSSLVPVSTLALRAIGVDNGIALWVFGACAVGASALAVEARRAHAH